MIAIFTVLGFILFCGGGYAIYDGWPYLVLERGFTQVIIGAIASSAGLILLSLAWVLREIRSVKLSLAEAAQVRAALSQPVPPPLAHPSPEVAGAGGMAPAGMPAAAGAVAGAVAAGAAADVLAMPAREEAASAREAAPPVDRDLFGSLVARRLDDPEPIPDEAPVTASAEEAEPLPDMFEDVPAARSQEPREQLIAIEAESHEPAEIVAAKVQPVGEDEALAHSDDRIAENAPSPVEDDKADDRPAESDSDSDEPGPIRATPDLDEFSALRDSLTGHLNEPGRDGTRVEPSLPAEPDPFAAAEVWMDKVSPRTEPWFDEPPANEAGAAEAASPPWPPRTEAPSFEAPPEPSAEEPPAPPAGEERPAEPGEDTPAPVAAGSTESEGKVEEGPAAPSERQASDEGVVGAYQVGDAHFTIYADGSIRARTPDGEYSFASMDELKVYLASEKSRLGV